MSRRSLPMPNGCSISEMVSFWKPRLPKQRDLSCRQTLFRRKISTLAKRKRRKLRRRKLLWLRPRQRTTRHRLFARPYLPNPRRQSHPWNNRLFPSRDGPKVLAMQPAKTDRYSEQNRNGQLLPPSRVTALGSLLPRLRRLLQQNAANRQNQLPWKKPRALFCTRS